MIVQLTAQGPDVSTVTLPLVEAPILLVPLSVNLLVGLVLALVLRAHFLRFGSTLSNREQFGGVFPFILLTTLLIITIVKSSLALSLGLVGALSIVRFRTPIKEPEELAYLFIAIAMGLGLGANQTVTTIVGGLFILAVTALFKRRSGSSESQNLYLSVDWSGSDVDPSGVLDSTNKLIKQHTARSDLRRFDVRDGSAEATYFIDVHGADQLSTLVRVLQLDGATGVTFIDQNQLPSL